MQPVRPKDRLRILQRDPYAQPRIEESDRLLSERFVNPRTEATPADQGGGGSASGAPFAAPERSTGADKARELHRQIYGVPVAQSPDEPRFADDLAVIGPDGFEIVAPDEDDEGKVR